MIVHEESIYITRQEDLGFMFSWQELFLQREHKIHVFELYIKITRGGGVDKLQQLQPLDVKRLENSTKKKR